jgi:flavorubredoxin
MKIVVIYDSKSGNTEKMAIAIAQGLEEAGVIVEVKKVGERFPLSIIDDVDAIMFGSPVIYSDITSEMRDFIGHINRVAVTDRYNTKDRIVAIFGSYGYDGAWIMEEMLKKLIDDMGYKVYENIQVETDTEIRYNTEDALKRARAFGKKFAESI